MPICQPCRMPHRPEVCEDTLAGRTGLARSCFCQHKPHSTAVSAQPAAGAGAPGGESEAADTEMGSQGAVVVGETVHAAGDIVTPVGDAGQGLG